MALNKGLFKKPVSTNTHCTEYLCCDSEFGFEGSDTLWDPVSGLGGPNVNAMMLYLDTFFENKEL